MVRAVDQEAVDRAMGGASVRPERKMERLMVLATD